MDQHSGFAADHSEEFEDDEQSYAVEVRFEVIHAPRATAEWPGILDVSGSVVLVDDNDEVVERVGEVDLMLFREESAGRVGYPLSEQCDAHSQMAHDIHSLLFESNGELRAAVSRCVGDVFSGDVLVITCIKIQPEYRGHRLGLEAADAAVALFGPSSGLVVCKPFPLQFDVRNRDDPEALTRLGAANLSKSQRTATRKLRSYWSQLGFRPVPKSPYFALSLCYARPSREELGLGEHMLRSAVRRTC